MTLAQKIHQKIDEFPESVQAEVLDTQTKRSPNFVLPL